MANAYQFFRLLSAGAIGLLAGCGSSASDCNVLCSDLPQANACRPYLGGMPCVMICSTDDDCPAEYYAGCNEQADDGTKICGGNPRDRDAGVNDSG